MADLTVVNDPAERPVKLVQDFVNGSQDEELRQDLFLAVNDHRSRYSVHTKAELAKIGSR